MTASVVSKGNEGTSDNFIWPQFQPREWCDLGADSQGTADFFWAGATGSLGSRTYAVSDYAAAVASGLVDSGTGSMVGGQRGSPSTTLLSASTVGEVPFSTDTDPPREAPPVSGVAQAPVRTWTQKDIL